MNLFFDEKRQEPRVFPIIVAVVLFFLSLFGVAWPFWTVWEQEMVGKAELSRATFSRKVLVQEAEAKKEAATLLGEAEVARAHGLAEANKIVGNSLGGPENYLRYLWIQNIDKVSGQVIYVPTEVGLPLTEAGKRPNHPGDK
jgi:hypothetical protein